MIKLTSPEKLDDYVRTTTPSMWIILISIILILAGGIFWCIFGQVEIHNPDGSTEEVSPITFIMN